MTFYGRAGPTETMKYAIANWKKYVTTRYNWIKVHIFWRNLTAFYIINNLIEHCTFWYTIHDFGKLNIAIWNISNYWKSRLRFRLRFMRKSKWFNCLSLGGTIVSSPSIFSWQIAFHRHKSCMSHFEKMEIQLSAKLKYTW